MYYLSEEDLKNLWIKSWILSKGYDKEFEKPETLYRDESFNSYLTKLLTKDKSMDNKKFVILGDVVTPIIDSIPEDENSTNMEKDKDESN